MPSINGGFYLKARCVQSSYIAHAPPCVREIWDWMLMRAMHKDGKDLKRGQLICTYRDIQEGLHWFIGFRKMTYSKWDCERALKALMKATMITTTKTTSGLIVSIINYAKYQDARNYESHNESHNEATMKPQTTETIEKNEEELKNEKNRYKETLPIGNPNRYKEPLTRESGAAPPPTPREEAEDFFTNGDKQRAVVEWLKAKGIPEQAAVQEVAKFVSYWTEPSLSGKRQRWQTEKTFEIKRRLATWFSKSQDFGKTKPKFQVYNAD